ncbi:peptidyl-prolyl cis-trans isomerase FKBP1A-like [Tubulanus polymorphus]|uniref:peptidyl-prolyl cis-trans isomerase FKBP1A-like n=1 Tax=Tubulanus polymorphus TaxID=672921 RepID=UPI003DA54FCC
MEGVSIGEKDGSMRRLEKGVTVEILRQGDGKTFPKKGQTAVVDYIGRLTDNTEFDSSVKRGKPFKFLVDLGHVIVGWDIAIKTMSVGEKSMVTCPSDVAYGDLGHPGVIPPKATLIFEMNLVKIE